MSIARKKWRERKRAAGQKRVMPAPYELDCGCHALPDGSGMYLCPQARLLIARLEAARLRMMRGDSGALIEHERLRRECLEHIGMDVDAVLRDNLV